MELQEIEEKTPEQIEKEEKKKELRTFLIKLSLYVTFGLIVPLSFLIWRFDLFTGKRSNIASVWGVIAVVITAIFLSVLAKQAERCIENLQYRQIVTGIRKVFIPLIATALIFWGLSSFFKELVQVFVVLAFSETIAYVINPFPAYIKIKEEEEKDKKDENKLLKFAKLFWQAKE